MKRFLLFLFLLCLSSEAMAIPTMLTHQGKILNSDSSPVSGVANVDFKLYTQETGGSPIWSQTISVTFDEGAYSVTLGPGNPELSTDFFDGSNAYLGIALEGAGEFDPRHKIVSVPYAFRAGSVTGEVNAEGGLTVDGQEIIDSSGVVHANGLVVGDNELIDNAGNLTLPRGLLSELPTASEDNEGQVYYATDTGTIYYSNGSEWTEVGSGSGIEAPVISNLSPAQIEPSTDTPITLNGQSFQDGAAVHFGSTVSSSVEFTDATQVIATSSELDTGLYDVKIINPVGLIGYMFEGLEVDGSPEWSTTAGSLGIVSCTEEGDFFTLEATDPESQELTFTIAGGALPEGVTLSEGGIIQGSPAEVSEDTEFSFDVSLADTARTPHSVVRSFSMTIAADRSPEWVTNEGSLGEIPHTADGDLFTLEATDPESQELTYTIVGGALPNGVTLSEDGIIQGSPDEVSEDTVYSFDVRVTDTATEPNSVDRSFTITVVTRPPVHMWSGYCSSHGRSSGWNKYCANVTEFNTLDGKLSIASDGTFTVNEAGYYRVNMWAISQSSGWAYVALYVNGSYRYHGHEYVHGSWSDSFMDTTWPMNEGDTFDVRIHNPNSYAYHSGNSSENHSLLQVEYKGPINEYPMWSGYCSSHNRENGWQKFCTNGENWNNLSDKISVNTDGTFTVNEAGYYRVNFFTISCTSSYVHVRLMVNGSYKYHGYEHSHSQWTDNFMDQTWPFNEGDTFYVDIHNNGGGCDYAYHSANANGAHNRLQVEYKGPLNEYPMWSGYCSSHNRGNSYQTYCANTTEWNNLTSELSVNSDGTFTVNEAGYYRVNLFAASCTNGYAHARMLINGSAKRTGYEYSHNTWTDNFIDNTWFFDAGDTFKTQINNVGNSCDYAYHSGNVNGAHSRLQVHYLGVE